MTLRCAAGLCTASVEFLSLVTPSTAVTALFEAAEEKVCHCLPLSVVCISVLSHAAFASGEARLGVR